MDLEQKARGIAQRVGARYNAMRMKGNSSCDLYSMILTEEIKGAGFRTPDELSFMRKMVAKAAAARRDVRRKRKAS